MEASNLLARNRATLKLLFVGALSMATLIPLSMVHSIISERQAMQLSAETTIANRWGGSQSISGLVALINSPVVMTGERSFETRYQWLMSEMSTHLLNTAGFGMRLETPVDRFQRSERSVKYGFLFITLTFFTLFLFEVLTGRPLHPVPYVLTGAALAVFYLVLLALSEYLSYSVSFVVAASLLVLIVTPYTGAVLGKRRRGYLVGAMMSITYGLLYVLVSSQHLSLLLGSMALLMAIASLMFVTRNVDWYSYGADE